MGKQDSLCFSHFVLPVQTFTAKTHYAVYTEANHPPSLHIPLLIRKFHLDSFFPRAAALQKRPVRGGFSGHYNLNLFNFKFNRYLYPNLQFLRSIYQPATLNCFWTLYWMINSIKCLINDISRSLSRNFLFVTIENRKLGILSL